MQNTREATSPQSLRHSIRDFFYAEEIPYGMAIVRMLLPLSLLAVVIPRWFYTRELFSLDGAATPLANNYGVQNFPPEIPGTLAVALMTILALTLVTSAVGWRTRLSLIISTILYTYLNLLDSLSTITKYSVIATHVLFLLSLSNCGAVWSVDVWLKGKWPKRGAVAGRPAEWPRHPAWQRRLMQLLFGAIYFGAAITKMHTPGFLTGDQMLFWMMTNVNNYNPFGEYLTLYPSTLVFCGYISIVWEMLFIFVAWRGWARIIMLSLGTIFHIMTTLTLGLYIFPLVMIASYFCFLNERDVGRVSALMRRCRGNRQLAENPSIARRWKLPIAIPLKSGYSSAAAFGFVLVFVTWLGIVAEHWLDPYGIRRNEGPYALKELDPVQVNKMLTQTTTIRPKDKILAFDAGTKMIGGILSNRKYDYRQGDYVIAQCTFNPPHEDMWIECNLHDGDNRIVDRTGQVATRSMIRSNFLYNLTDSLAPGRYSLVLKTAGREIARRAITLRPRESDTGIQAPAAH